MRRLNSRCNVADRAAIPVLTFFCLATMTGCGEFFAEKPTELQTRNILKQLSQINTIADPNARIPDIYTRPPVILEMPGKGVKLFYFTRHHTPAKLTVTVQEQLGGTVSVNEAVNQMVIECTSREDAELTLSFLELIDVPPIQVRIDCLVSELFADVTMDWETTIQIDNLFGEGVTLGGKVVDGVLLPAFPGASLREPARAKLGLKVGYSKNLNMAGHEFRALVDVLVSRGYLKILMNPVLEVVNGQTAKIITRDNVPLPKEVVTKLAEPYTTTEYVWVEDSLEVTPHVFADGYIGLETSIKISSKSTPEGVKQIPIITERTITNGENRIRQGESLIIGGLRKTERRSVVRGVPFLKDIPIIGVLFSSKDFEERAKEVIFILTPTISNYGVPNEEMVELIRKKHKAPVPEELKDVLMDSLSGLGGVTEFFKPQQQNDLESPELPEGVSYGPLLTEMDPNDISQGDPNQTDAADKTE